MSDERRKKLELVHSAELAGPKDAKKYVRITERMSNGMIGFDFAIGSPDLFVELVLPEAAFKDFCETNKAEFMTEEESAIVDAEMQKWRYGEEGMQLKRAAALSRANADEDH